MSNEDGETKTFKRTKENLRRLQPKDSDHELLCSLVNIPQNGEKIFSFQKLWAFTGPGFLISISFLDPGNIELDLITGSQTQYRVFWVLLWSTLLGILLQRLSARVGVVTGQHLAQICYTEYKPVWRVLIWLMMEIAIVSADMQEVIGTTTAIYLLSKGLIPLWGGVLFTVIEVFTIMLFDKYGLRKLELFFAILIGTMALSFGIEFFLTEPDYTNIALGILKPLCEKCSSNDIQQAETIVGIFVVPHAIYLHSGLVKTRNIDRSNDEKISEANFYYLVELVIALSVSYIINFLVMATFAKELYGKTNSQIYPLCKKKNFLDTVFPNDHNQAITNIESGGVFLGCKYGEFALYIWSIGILASGQGSTMTDCYTGQFVMEGFLNLKWVRWKRVLFTRAMTLLPTLYIANYTNLSAMSALNDFLNILSDLQIPFALLPVIAFSSNKYIMGAFANGLCHKVIAVSIFILITSLNGIFIVDYIVLLIKKWPIWTQITVMFIGLIYLSICLYLVLHTAAALTNPDSCLNKNSFMKKYVLGESMTKGSSDATSISDATNINGTDPPETNMTAV